MNEKVQKIAAGDLIALIKSTKPTAEIENDEDIYVQPMGEIEVDDDGLCSLVVHPDLGNSLDMGNFRIEIGGVDITVTRELDGPGDDYEFDGVEIEYGDDVSEDDVIKAIEENVNFPPYDELQYNITDFAPGDVDDSITVDEGDVYAKDADGNVYQYSDESEGPEDQTVIEAGEAVHMLVEAWSEDGGDVDAITASTITSRAFLRAVNAANQAYHNTLVKEDNADGISGASQQKHN